ncbi:MAG TPA: hypothetical protein VFW98_04920 [Gemmatimonadaceae bacterium]|nr:hypothetical protein [Gemmatimonadaceae bacterium]
MVIGILLVAAFVLLIEQQIVFVRLSAYRTDIRPGASPFAGRSRIAQRNFLRPGNYRPEGRRLLAIFYTLQVLWLGVLLALFSRFAR